MKAFALMIFVTFVLASIVDYTTAGYGHYGGHYGGHGGHGGYASHWQYDNGLHAPYKGHGGHGYGLHGGHGYGYGHFGR